MEFLERSKSDRFGHSAKLVQREGKPVVIQPIAMLERHGLKLFNSHLNIMCRRCKNTPRQPIRVSAKAAQVQSTSTIGSSSILQSHIEARLATPGAVHMNVGEQLVSSYLRHIRKCDFIQTNVQTADSQGEIDVVAIDLKAGKVYVCEVAVHMTTGLQYVKGSKTNNVAKLIDKFSRDIAYVRTYLKEYEAHYMLWSPVVKDSRGKLENNQMGHLAAVKAKILEDYGLDLECIVNADFQKCLKEMREFAGRQTSELQCPLMRLMQIEELLGLHVNRANQAKGVKAQAALVRALDAPAVGGEA